MDLHIPNVFNETPGTLRRIAELLQTFADQAERAEAADGWMSPRIDTVSAQMRQQLDAAALTSALPLVAAATLTPPVTWQEQQLAVVDAHAATLAPPPPILTAAQAETALFGQVNATEVFRQQALAAGGVPAAGGVATPTPPPPPVTGTKLDAAGFPWDGRIHASTKTTTADGNWKRKKGVAPELVAEVEAQWKAVAALPTPGAVSPQAPLAPVVAPTPPPTTTAATATATSATISPSDAGTPTTFTDIVVRIARLQSAGKLTREQVDAALGTIGIPSTALLAARADLIPQAWAMIAAMVAA